VQGALAGGVTGVLLAVEHVLELLDLKLQLRPFFQQLVDFLDLVVELLPDFVALLDLELVFLQVERFHG